MSRDRYMRLTSQFRTWSMINESFITSWLFSWLLRKVGKKNGPRRSRSSKENYIILRCLIMLIAISLDERIHVFSNETEMFLCIPPCKWENRLLLLSSFLSYNIASYRRDYVRDDVKRTSINLGYFLGSIVVIAWKYDSLVHCWDTQVDTDF